MMRRGRQRLLGGQRPTLTGTAELRAVLACWDAVWKADGLGEASWPGSVRRGICSQTRAWRRGTTPEHNKCINLSGNQLIAAGRAPNLLDSDTSTGSPRCSNKPCALSDGAPCCLQPPPDRRQDGAGQLGQEDRHHKAGHEQREECRREAEPHGRVFLHGEEGLEGRAGPLRQGAARHAACVPASYGNIWQPRRHGATSLLWRQ